MTPRDLAPGVLLVTLVAAAALAGSSLLGEFVNRDWIDREVRSAGAAGQLAFVGIAGLATALAFPRQVVSFLGGYAFGAGLGTLLALAGTELGCAFTFLCARLFGRPLLGERLRAKLRPADDFLVAHPFSTTLLIRLLPVGNNFATCVAAGVSRIPVLPFLAGSALGHVPQTLAFALAGSGVELEAWEQVGLAAVLLACSGALGAWLYFRRGTTRAQP